MDLASIKSSYQEPVSWLLSMGEPGDGEWCDYAGMGITAGHVPDLIRMALDEKLHDADGESVEVWAPVRAWRALGQLRAVEAITPLLTLFRRADDGDDWIQTDLVRSLAEIGTPVIEPAAAFLADTNHGEWARIAAADTLGKTGESHPELRAECVAKLAAQLEKFSEQSDTLNTFLILPLYDLRAVETMPLIQRAYAAGCVDESVMGDVEDVQIHFGLKKEREHPRKLEKFWDFDERVARMQAALDLEDAAMREEAQGVIPQPYIAPQKIGRNDPCPCGSGKKYKKCCGK